MVAPAAGKTGPSDALMKDLLESLDKVFGLHPGFRAVHAKGAVCSGTFAPAAGAGKLTRAPHIARASTDVLVRLSNFAGVPNIPDNDPGGAGPRGIGIRFYLGEHVHSDIVAHSYPGFPVRDGEGFLGFARALAASGPGTAKPSPIEVFLSKNPAAMKFAMAPKPFPTSLARESFFGVSSFLFTNQAGVKQYGRYKILPEAGNEYLSAEDAAKKSPIYLMEEIPRRLGDGPIKFRIAVQLAAPGDEVNDATVQWPDTRPEVEFGTITLTKVANAADPEIAKIILDPRPQVDGIEASADPLFEVRAGIYILSGRRRRAAGK